MKGSDMPAMPEVEKAPHAHYMRPLDGIRGMACMLVIASHVSRVIHLSFEPSSGFIGSLGVLIFFSLSGFLMTMLYADEKFDFNAASRYAIARFSRIAPAYWIAVLFVWVIYMMIPDFFYQMTPLMMFRSFLFGGNQGVFWSIPPEIQFYVFFGGLWFALHKFKEGKPYWLVSIALICVACFATRTMWGGLVLPSKLHIFLYGFLAAMLLKRETFRKIICTVYFQAGIGILAAVYAALFITKDNIYTDLLFPALISLWIASMSASTWLSRPFETATMRLVGAASFSIYLFHEPILLLLSDLGVFDHMTKMPNILLMCLISLMPPVVFHFLAEKRLNKSSRARGLSILERINRRWPKTVG